MSRVTKFQAFDDGVDAWQIVEAPPAGRLAASVDRYSWWRETTTSFTARRELAATCGVFIINLGAPLEIVDASDRTIRLDAGEAFIGGMAQGTSLSRSTGAMEGIHVHLPVEELARTLGVSVGAITDATIRLDDVVGQSAHDLGHQLLEAATLDARFEMLDAFLNGRLGHTGERSREISHAFGRLRGGSNVSELAEELGWSRKRLASWFRDMTGLRPAQFSRLARFERFTSAIQAEPAASLAELACDAGYVDQAHLTHDVRRLSRMTPGELRARLIPAGGGVRD